MKVITFAALGTLLLTPVAFSQTHLPAGSDVYGDFSVGTSADKGGLSIVGQTGNTATPGLSITGDGGVVWNGTYGTGLIPASGAGTRLMWYPRKSAFRAGTVTGANWDDANIGIYSVALGYNSKANGSNAVAFGNTSTANGYGSIAIGMSTATGDSAVAMGLNSNATGNYSVAFPYLCYATGFASVALGLNATASNTGAFAEGLVATASGPYSVAMGYFPIASGSYTYAAGYYTSATSAYCAVFGRYNYIEGTSATAWVETDPLFVIGNGTGVTTDPAEKKNRNALTVYKNGNVKITKRQGDIAMGAYGTPGSND